jgi:transcriptional regulator with XRE-family HTH domain
MEIANAFGIVLRELRKEAGLTQEGLGLDADLRRTFVSLLELGHQQPTIQTIFKLSVALNKSPSEIIARVEDVLNLDD